MEEAEFYQLVREKYGARGVLNARSYIETAPPLIDEKLSEGEKEAFRAIKQSAWLAAKDRAHEKFTPKKYRAQA